MGPGPADEPPTAGSAHRLLAARFARAGIPTPELDARLLLCAAAGIPHERFVRDPSRPLIGEHRDRLEGFAKRRLGREPVSRILGARSFWRDTFRLDQCLDPRPETETLVEAALTLVRERSRMPDRPRLLDLGTGSGCILLSLLGELDGAWGLGVDISAAALAAARGNARRLGLEARAAFVCASWADGLSGRFDLVLANPPYISTGRIEGLDPEVASFDPRIALDGGPDGLDAFRAIVPELPRLLKPGGWAAIEIGEGQLDAVARLIGEAGFALDGDGFRVFQDLARITRCVAVRKRPRAGGQKEVGN